MKQPKKDSRGAWSNLKKQLRWARKQKGGTWKAAMEHCFTPEHIIEHQLTPALICNLVEGRVNLTRDMRQRLGVQVRKPQPLPRDKKNVVFRGTAALVEYMQWMTQGETAPIDALFDIQENSRSLIYTLKKENKSK